MNAQFSALKIDGHDLISMWVSSYPISFSVQMSPEKARELADMLIDAARKIEARTDEEVAEVISDG